MFAEFTAEFEGTDEGGSTSKKGGFVRSAGTSAHYQRWSSLLPDSSLALVQPTAEGQLERTSRPVQGPALRPAPSAGYK